MRRHRRPITTWTRLLVLVGLLLSPLGCDGNGTAGGVTSTAADPFARLITPLATRTPTPTLTPKTELALDVPFISQIETNTCGTKGMNNCGPASLAMVAEFYGLRPTTLSDNAEYVRQIRVEISGKVGDKDYVCNQDGISDEQLKAWLDDKHLEAKQTSSLTEALEATKSGYPCIVAVKGLKLKPAQTPESWFMKNGIIAEDHLLVLRGEGLKDGKPIVYVNDPLCYWNETGKPCTEDDHPGFYFKVDFEKAMLAHGMGAFVVTGVAAAGEVLGAKATAVPERGTTVPTTTPQPAQSSLPLKLQLASQIGGSPIFDVIVRDNFAYVSGGQGITVLDVMNPSNPIVLGRSGSPSIQLGRIVLGKSHLYASGISRLFFVFDISNPAAPKQVSYMKWLDIWGLATAGNYLYAAAGQDGLRILDISDPTNPSEVGHYEPRSVQGDAGDVKGVVVVGKYAYVTDSQSPAELRIVDVSNPKSPAEVGHCNVGGSPVGVSVAGSYAFVASETRGLSIVDVSNPTSPKQISEHILRPGAARVLAIGQYVYLSDDHWGLRVIDVSAPSNPREVGFYPQSTQNVAVSAGKAYIAAGDGGLRIVDLSNPARPNEIGAYGTAMNSVSSVAIAEHFAYVADDQNVYTIDVSDPHTPMIVGTCAGFQLPRGLAALDDRLYVLDSTGLNILNTSNPADLIRITTVPVAVGNEPAHDIAIVGNMAYVFGKGVHTIDLSDPDTASEVTWVNHEVRYRAMVVQDGHIYALGDEIGLQIIGTPDLALSDLLGTKAFEGANMIAVSQNYAYVAPTGKERNEIAILDVSNPNAPRQVGSVKSNWRLSLGNLVADGNRLFVTEAAGTSVHMIDFDESRSTAVVTSYAGTAGYVADMAVAGNQVYLTTMMAGPGFVILELVSDTESPAAKKEIEPAPAATAVANPTAMRTPAVMSTPTCAPDAIVDSKGDPPRVNVRDGPDTSYAVLTKVQHGERVTILYRNDRGDWLYIQAGDGQRGWMSAEFARAACPLTSYPVTATPPPPTRTPTGP